MTARFIPQSRSIKKEGLQPYLDRTTEIHDGYGYQVFKKEIAKPKQTDTAIARMFLVDRQTIKKWKQVDDYEAKVAKQQAEMDELNDV